MSRAVDVNKIAYNMNEAAHALGVSRAQVYRMIKRGDLRKFTWAGRSLIKADVLHAAIDRAADAIMSRLAAGQPTETET